MKFSIKMTKYRKNYNFKKIIKKSKRYLIKWQNKERNNIWKQKIKKELGLHNIQLKIKFYLYCMKTILEDLHLYKLSHYQSHYNKT
jgi:hypothetical protein